MNFKKILAGILAGATALTAMAIGSFAESEKTEVDTSNWTVAIQGVDKWQAIAGKPGELTLKTTVAAVMEANGIANIEDFGGIALQIWGVGDEGDIFAPVNYTLNVGGSVMDEGLSDELVVTEYNSVQIGEYKTKRGGNYQFKAEDEIVATIVVPEGSVGVTKPVETKVVYESSVTVNVQDKNDEGKFYGETALSVKDLIGNTKPADVKKITFTSPTDSTGARFYVEYISKAGKAVRNPEGSGLVDKGKELALTNVLLESMADPADPTKTIEPSFKVCILRSNKGSFTINFKVEGTAAGAPVDPTPGETEEPDPGKTEEPAPVVTKVVYNGKTTIDVSTPKDGKFYGEAVLSVKDLINTTDPKNVTKITFTSSQASFYLEYVNTKGEQTTTKTVLKNNKIDLTDILLESMPDPADAAKTIEPSIKICVLRGKKTPVDIKWSVEAKISGEPVNPDPGNTEVVFESSATVEGSTEINKDGWGEKLLTVKELIGDTDPDAVKSIIFSSDDIDFYVGYNDIYGGWSQNKDAYKKGEEAALSDILLSATDTSAPYIKLAVSAQTGSYVIKWKVMATVSGSTPSETDAPAPSETDAPVPDETDAPAPVETDAPGTAGSTDANGGTSNPSDDKNQPTGIAFAVIPAVAAAVAVVISKKRK